MGHEFKVTGYREFVPPFPVGPEQSPGVPAVVALASLVITPPYRAGPILESVILGKVRANGFSIQEVGSDVTPNGATTYRVTSASASRQSRQADFRVMGERVTRLADDPGALAELENDTPFEPTPFPPHEFIGR